jgi:hypothetical protein
MNIEYIFFICFQIFLIIAGQTWFRNFAVAAAKVDLKSVVSGKTPLGVCSYEGKKTSPSVTPSKKLKKVTPH